MLPGVHEELKFDDMRRAQRHSVEMIERKE